MIRHVQYTYNNISVEEEQGLKMHKKKFKKILKYIIMLVGV